MATALRFWDHNLLKGMRKRIGVTQASLAQTSGFTLAFIANYESGRRRLATDDAMKLWEALAGMAVDPDQAGQAWHMAYEAALSEKRGAERNLREVEAEVKRKLEAYKGFLAKAEADEERIKKFASREAAAIIDIRLEQEETIPLSSLLKNAPRRK